ncbi:hypothetical protein [Vibrio owensii]|uniref:hypothetical protein n=1 Tax=Vibrio owensii TaxID=696485 RepID=UPI0018F21F5F|nr:hypothetical protein [Vibrio owensii]
MERINLAGHFPIGAKVKIHELIIPGTVLETGTVRETQVTEITGVITDHHQSSYQAIQVKVLTEDGVAERLTRSVWHQINLLDHLIK